MATVKEPSKLSKALAPTIGAGSILALLVFVASLLTTFAPVWASLTALEQIGLLVPGVLAAVATLVGGVVLFVFGPKYGIDPNQIINMIKEIVNLLVNAGLLKAKNAPKPGLTGMVIRVATPLAAIGAVAGLFIYGRYMLPTFTGDIVALVLQYLGALFVAISTIIGAILMYFRSKA